MKTLFKTFLLMLLIGGVALLVGTVLLHTQLFAHTLHNSLTWTLVRCLFYMLIIIFRNKLGVFLAKRHNLDSKEINSILPNRWKLIVFFGVIEIFIIQGGLAYLVGKCMELIA